MTATIETTGKKIAIVSFALVESQFLWLIYILIYFQRGIGFFFRLFIDNFIDTLIALFIFPFLIWTFSCIFIEIRLSMIIVHIYLWDSFSVRLCDVHISPCDCGCRRLPYHQIPLTEGTKSILYTMYHSSFYVHLKARCHTLVAAFSFLIFFIRLILWFIICVDGSHPVCLVASKTFEVDCSCDLTHDDNINKA